MVLRKVPSMTISFILIIVDCESDSRYSVVYDLL